MEERNCRLVKLNCPGVVASKFINSDFYLLGIIWQIRMIQYRQRTISNVKLLLFLNYRLCWYANSISNILSIFMN